MTESEIANVLTPLAILLAALATAKWPGEEGGWFGRFWIYLIAISLLLAVGAVFIRIVL